MAINADMFTDMIQAAMKNPHVWAVILSIVLIIGFVALIYLWASNSEAIRRDDI